MRSDAGNSLLEALDSEAYRRRLVAVHRFEEISGGGIVKQLERLVTAPRIYIPYLIYAKLGLSRFLRTTATLFWGRRMRIKLDDYDALILRMYGALYGAELHFARFLIKNLGSEDVFYDIGANRGFYTFLASELCKETHSFEPLPELAEVIEEGVRPDDAIFVNAAAVSDTDGTIEFHITESTMVNTINSEVAKHLATQDHVLTRTLTVPTIALDTYTGAHATPTFLKIDVEGAEGQVIEGGRILFSRNAPVIAMEVWGKENTWELSMRAVERLRALGYRSYRLDEEGEIHEVEGDLSERVIPLGGENFIFKKY